MVTVDAVDMSGQPITGMYVVLESSAGVITNGYTPVNFTVIQGENYTLTATDNGQEYFNHWTNNFTVRVIPITGTDHDVVYTAAYADSVQPPPTTTPYSITVTSHDLNGTEISGFYVDVRVNGYHIADGTTPFTFTNLEPGVPFQLIYYWYGNYWLRELSNNDLNRYALVTFNTTGATSVSLDGLYQYVPKAEAVALQVNAQFPNGTVLGTTFNNTSYIQHTPGMWVTVTPPGSSTPFTGTFTGGSILPFILFRGETYTVTMTTGYAGCLKFQSWQDTGSQDNVRPITLQGNTTITAIYDQTGACPTTTVAPGEPGIGLSLMTRPEDYGDLTFPIGGQ